MLETGFSDARLLRGGVATKGKKKCHSGARRNGIPLSPLRYCYCLYPAYPFMDLCDVLAECTCISGSQQLPRVFGFKQRALIMKR